MHLVVAQSVQISTTAQLLARRWKRHGSQSHLVVRLAVLHGMYPTNARLAGACFAGTESMLLYFSCFQSKIHANQPAYISLLVSRSVSKGAGQLMAKLCFICEFTEPYRIMFRLFPCLPCHPAMQSPVAKRLVQPSRNDSSLDCLATNPGVVKR